MNQDKEYDTNVSGSGMICTNCFQEEYKTAKTELTVSINGEKQVLRDLDCETCPACGEVTFTHAQSLEIDKKRIALEFGARPLLTAAQLKMIRRFLGMKLDEICDLLHIGRNTYGRWERGEVAITPSMNLLVHNLIEKIPDAREKVLEIKEPRQRQCVPRKGKELQQVCREHGETYSNAPESVKGRKTRN